MLAGHYRCRQYGAVIGSFFIQQASWGPSFVSRHIVQAPGLHGGSVLKRVTFDGFSMPSGSSYSYPSELQVGCSSRDRNFAITNDVAVSKGPRHPVTGEPSGDGLTYNAVDAHFPMFTSGLEFGSSTDAESMVHFYPPDQGFVGDMGVNQIDADGPRNSLIIDTDGSLLSGGGGTVIPENEIRWTSNMRFPDPQGRQTPSDLLNGRLILDADGNSLSTAEIYDHPGLSRASGDCTWSADHNAYSCIGGQHRQLILEDMTHRESAMDSFALALTLTPFALASRLQIRWRRRSHRYVKAANPPPPPGCFGENTA